MDVSIIVGLVGVGGVVVGNLITYLFQEGRRKSDRRRELYEADLRIIRDGVYLISEVVTGSMMAEEQEERAGLIRQAQAMLLKALFVAGAVGDEELAEGVKGLLGAYGAWVYAIDLRTGKPKSGKVDELMKTASPIQKAASKVLRRIREMLEEV